MFHFHCAIARVHPTPCRKTCSSACCCAAQLAKASPSLCLKSQTRGTRRQWHCRRQPLPQRPHPSSAACRQRTAPAPAPWPAGCCLAAPCRWRAAPAALQPAQARPLLWRLRRHAQLQQGPARAWPGRCGAAARQRAAALGLGRPVPLPLAAQGCDAAFPAGPAPPRAPRRQHLRTRPARDLLSRLRRSGRAAPWPAGAALAARRLHRSALRRPRCRPCRGCAACEALLLRCWLRLRHNTWAGCF